MFSAGRAHLTRQKGTSWILKSVPSSAKRSIVHQATASTPATSPFAPRHFLSIADLSSAELLSLVHTATAAKQAIRAGRDAGSFTNTLSGKTVAMIFSKRSTRTRVSTESALSFMGAHPLFLGKEDIQMGVNETIADTAKVISSMTAGMVVRGDAHETITELASTSSVPIINGLTDSFHPLQAIASMLTLSEVHPLESFKSLKIAWVGDANNVIYDLALACAKMGISISIATPASRPYPEDMLELARSHGKEHATKIETTHQPEEAVKNSDIIVTDTWISMGQEAEKARKLKEFAGFQVTTDLAQRGGAKADWKFMHCLPRKQEEVSDEVFYSPRALVFEEAENRLYAAVGK